ncbi:MAG: dihydroorotate dehydrogenase-like protein [Phycisphaerales bacterium]|nr:dihydroorotate dehydrogenase-like protein [Phycisphaerales bacterium]
MANLGVTYLGLDLAHPFIAGAGPKGYTIDGVRALEDGGAAAIVLHSLYEEQLTNESMATHESIEGHADSFGEALSFLPSPEDFVLGPNEYLDHLRRAKEAVGVPVIASLNGYDAGPWLDYATLVQEAGADAIELNLFEIVTDPAVTAFEIEERKLGLVRGIRARTTLPVAVKLSPFFASLPNFVARVLDAGATGIVLFNRFYEPDINTEELELVPHLALSTNAILHHRLRWLSILSGRIGCPLAVSGGVHDVHDAIKAIMAGAHAVQMVSAAFLQGADVYSVVRDGVEEWMDEHEYDSLIPMRGSMNIDRGPNPQALTRAQYVRTFPTWTPHQHA